MIKRRSLLLVIVLVAIVANFFSPFRVQRISIHLAPEVILRVGPWTISNTLIGSWLGMTFLIVIALLVRPRLVDAPRAGSLQNIVEAACEALYNQMQSVVGNKARAFFPVVASFFLFILSCNWLALLPGFGSIGLWMEEEGQRTFVPFLRGSTSDLNTTLALATCSVLSSQIFGVRFLGASAYALRFIAIRKFIEFFRLLITEKVLRLRLLLAGALDVFVGLLEIFEELTKILSFSFRLFGNVFGAEVLLVVIAFLAPYVASLPFLALEVLGGFIQAFIFAILSTAFFGRATSGEHAEPEEPEVDHALAG